jgi:uncharacterized protein YuzE
MKLEYYSETDSLYIDLTDRRSAESREVCEGAILDHDDEDHLVGTDIDNASKKTDFKELVLTRMPARVRNLPA